MSNCNVCQSPYYCATPYEPSEPCLCGIGVSGESPWQYDGWRGVVNQLRYRFLRRLEKIMHPVLESLYDNGYWDLR